MMDYYEELQAEADRYKHLYEIFKRDADRYRAALKEAADELDAYYEHEYSGDHPYTLKKLAQAKASNPARRALEGKP